MEVEVSLNLISLISCGLVVFGIVAWIAETCLPPEMVWQKKTLDKMSNRLFLACVVIGLASLAIDYFLPGSSGGAAQVLSV